MKVAILNYAVCAIEIATIPQNIAESAENPSIGYSSEVIEGYLANELGYNLDEIEYMISDDDSIPLYENNGQTPTMTLCVTKHK